MWNDRLRQKREELGITQEELAELLDDAVSWQSISKWERGKTFPTVENLLLLSVRLKFSLDWLFADEFSYLRKDNKDDFDKFVEKYPGVIAGLNRLREILEKSNL